MLAAPAAAAAVGELAGSAGSLDPISLENIRLILAPVVTAFIAAAMLGAGLLLLGKASAASAGNGATLPAYKHIAL